MKKKAAKERKDGQPSLAPMQTATKRNLPTKGFFTNDNGPSTPTKKLIFTEKKVKIKTRGKAHPQDSDSSAAPDGRTAMAEDNTAAQERSPPKLRVDSRALETFRSLFYNPEGAARPGEVEWKDFQHALSAAGLTGKRMKGISWQFSTVSEEQHQKKCVQFHEPHGGAKLRSREVKKYGRRLRHVFDWGSETFALEE